MIQRFPVPVAIPARLCLSRQMFTAELSGDPCGYRDKQPTRSIIS